MSEITNSMRLELLSMKQNLGVARVAVAAFASQLDFTLNDLEEIKVAVSEAVTNSIIHGYGGKPIGLIDITCNLYRDALEILVADEGRGMEDTSQAKEPAATSEEEQMGLGFVFMRSFMNEVEVHSSPGAGMQVRLVRRVSPGPLPASPDS